MTIQQLRVSTHSEQYEHKEDCLKVMGLRRRFDILADLVGLERTADPREILDKTLEKLKHMR